MGWWSWDLVLDGISLLNHSFRHCIETGWKIQPAVLQIEGQKSCKCRKPWNNCSRTGDRVKDNRLAYLCKCIRHKQDGLVWISHYRKHMIWTSFHNMVTGLDPKYAKQDRNRYILIASRKQNKIISFAGWNTAYKWVKAMLFHLSHRILRNTVS